MDCFDSLMQMYIDIDVGLTRLVRTRNSLSYNIVNRDENPTLTRVLY